MKPLHVYRPPRNRHFLSTVIIFGGGALSTFLVFYLIPLMQQLEEGFREEEPDLIADLVVAPEEEYIPPEEEPEPEEEEPEPELAEETEDISIDPIDLPDLSAGMGAKVLLNITPSIALGGGGRDLGTEGVDSEPVIQSSASPTVPNAIRKILSQRGPVQVIVNGLVDEKGAVIEASVDRSSGIAALDQSAVKALRRYKFKPAIRNGRKARARVKQPFDFRVR